MSEMSKDKSASMIYNAMRRDTKSLNIKIKGLKTEDYSGYKIKVYPELVEGAGSMCSIITPKGTTLASRRGLDAAREFIDNDIANRRRVVFKLRREGNDSIAEGSTVCPRRRFRVKR